MGSDTDINLSHYFFRNRNRKRIPTYTMKDILAKLLKVQMELKPIKKDDVNPHFKNRYFDINSLLAEVKPILSANGLVLVQPLDKNTLSTNIYDVESGEYLGSTVNLPEMTDPQKMGSVISYFRRYSLVSLLAIEGEEDDDGNVASHQKPPVAPVSTQTADLGTCAKCGAANAQSKAGNAYCSKLCWKNPVQEVPVIEVPEDEVRLDEIPF